MLSDLLLTFKSLDFEALRPEDFFDKFRAFKQAEIDKVRAGGGFVPVPKCPVCDGPDRSLEFSFDGIGVVRCGNCSHRYTDQAPADLDEVYDSPDYLDAVKTFEMNADQYRANRFGLERADIVSSLLPGGKGAVLDVGCGWGFFLNVLKERGYNCKGLELTPSVARVAVERFGLDVETTPIEECTFKQQFDLITMFGVIEHLRRPGEVVQRCAELLRPGGYLLMFTPNFESVAIQLQQENANQVYPTQHLQHFCKRSMEEMCVRNGFVMHSYETKGLDCGDAYAWCNGLGRKDVAKFFKENGDVLQTVMDDAECANHMRVIFLKADKQE